MYLGAKRRYINTHFLSFYTFIHRVLNSGCLGVNTSNKSSAVAEMGDRLTTIDTSLKVGATLTLSVGGAGFRSNTDRHTDRQTGQRSHSIGWPKSFARTSTFLRRWRHGRQMHHLYSAGRPSRWASAHILVMSTVRSKLMSASVFACSSVQ